MNNNQMEQNNNYIQTDKKAAGASLKFRSFIIVIVMASFFGSVFGFMASAISSKFDFSDLGKSLINGEKIVNTEKIIIEDSEIISVVEKSSPAVVSIIITKEVPMLKSFDFFGFGYIPDNNGSTQRQQIGGGSGFFVTSDGMIVTNKHVVADENAEYTVLTNDEQEYSARVLARDPANDIALIKIEGSDFPVLQLGDSDKIKIGQTVIAIGNSLGEFSNTVSKGIISGLGRSLIAGGDYNSQSERLSNIIQTDAAINPGNSGGPLIGMQGEVLGINVAIVEGAQNIGFAIPINQVKKAIDQVSSTGKISTPFLGVRYIVLDENLQKANNLKYGYGALIQRGDNISDFAIVPGSPADKAGLVENDIILEINGNKIDDKNQLGDIISKHNVGDSITLKISHKGQEKKIDVVLEERE